MIGAIVLIIISFLMMTGGGSNDPAVFNPAIFSPLRIRVAPLVVTIGLGLMGYAIMHKGKEKKSE